HTRFSRDWSADVCSSDLVDVTAITPDGVVTSDGEISADAVLLAVGATPRTELAEAAGLSVTADGVVADSRLRTSDPDVWVAGDEAGRASCRDRGAVSADV